MEEFKVVGARDYVCWVAEGKVYESKNGKITFDNGLESEQFNGLVHFLGSDLEKDAIPLFKEYKEQQKENRKVSPLTARVIDVENRLSKIEENQKQKIKRPFLVEEIEIMKRRLSKLENQNKSDVPDVEQLSKVNSNLVRQNESLICKIHQMEKEIQELRKLKCSKVMPEEVVFNLDLAKNSFEITNTAGEHLMNYEVLLGRNVIENGKLSKQTFYLKMIKEDNDD